MMKKYIGVIVSVVLILIGALGSIIVALPSESKEYSVINKYINFVNNCDLEGMTNCTVLDAASQVLGADLGNIAGAISTDMTSKIDFLRASGLDVVNLLGEDIKEVTKISLVSIEKDESNESNFLSMATSEVSAVVKVTYVSEDDKKRTVTGKEVFTLVKIDNKYKIIS